MKILNGKELSGFIKESQAHQVSSLSHAPHLLIIRDSENPVIQKYVSLKIRYGEDIGIIVEDFFAKNSTEIAHKIQTANADPEIDAIILQLPILEKAKTTELTSLISPEKDVDNLSEASSFDSATATAILWLFSGYNIDLENRKIAVVGYGKLVGKPLSSILEKSHLDATVFDLGDNLNNLKNYDVIITATGSPGLIKSSMVKSGAILVDAGTASENGVIKGDLAEEVRNRTDLTAITPKLGGVGPLTISVLFDHVLQAARINSIKKTRA